MPWALIFAIALMQPPVIVIERDNVEITETCTIQIGANPIIDADNNGVVHITRGGIEVDFAGHHLHGSLPPQTPDSFSGIGVKITAQKVTLKNANISGFKVGVHAVNASGLAIQDCDVSNNFHQRLKSTPQAENASDWLWPHANDDNEWMKNYGAGICVEDSNHVTLRDIRARKTQNGIILDRVDDSKVYDCDCSFLSGWGLAIWRSNRNLVSRNAFDFCIRGYSHGVYNRGQDSAGILMFEQCNENVIAENSATHCGDGYFSFAGREALGEVNPRENQAWYSGRGCSMNRILRNDFSDSAAHGLETTFSFSNLIEANTFRGNAICGIWGGYSQGCMIRGNSFVRNGDAGYGLERGGINIESGSVNEIVANTFRSNACGIRLWHRPSDRFVLGPWYKSNWHDRQSAGAAIKRNSHDNDTVAIELRDNLQVVLDSNSFIDVGTEIDAQESVTFINPLPPHLKELSYWDTVHAGMFESIGRSRPVGARPQLAGRENIIMTEWGPWDHESPLLQFVQRFGHSDEYRLLGTKNLPGADQIKIDGNVFVDVEGDRIFVRPRAHDTLLPYSISFAIEGATLSAQGLLTGGTWEVWTFPSACDPRQDVDRWRREGEKEHHTLTADDLDLRFGHRGMTEARGLPVKLPHDHYGVIAKRTLMIPPGRWRLNTTSDDGIRVWIDGELVIDDWTHHGPTVREHAFSLETAKTVNLRVEYFELDGFACLTVKFAANLAPDP